MTDEKQPESPDLANASGANEPQAQVNEQNAQADEQDAQMNQPTPEEQAAQPESDKEHPPSSEDDMLKMLEDLPKDEASDVSDIDFGTEHEVSEAEFQQLSQPAGGEEPRNIEMLMDVNLPVAIELGRTRLAISDILALGPGSVVELNKLAGEPIDVLVNNKPIARGEVVVVDENFGVRITQLLTSEERLRALGDG